MRGCSPQTLPSQLQLSGCIPSIVSTSSQRGRISWLSISHGLLSPARAHSTCSGCFRRSQYSEVLRDIGVRHYSSKRWVQRQSQDPFAKAAKVAGLKSRAAFKLLQINDRYRLFKPGQTVVDLGFAPGSWSQVSPSSYWVSDLHPMLTTMARLPLTSPSPPAASSAST